MNKIDVGTQKETVKLGLKTGSSTVVTNHSAISKLGPIIGPNFEIQPIIELEPCPETELYGPKMNSLIKFVTAT